MGIPFNEPNRNLDLGFKPLPWGNDGYIPSQLQKLGSTSSAGILPVVPGSASVPLAIPNGPDTPPAASPADLLLTARSVLRKESPPQRILHILTSLNHETT
jgi:hypothetical protein